MKKSIAFLTLIMAHTMYAKHNPNMVDVVIKNPGDYVVTITQHGKELLKGSGNVTTSDQKDIAPESKIKVEAYNEKEFKQGWGNYTELQSVTLNTQKDTKTIEVSISGLFKKKLNVKMR